MTSDPARPAAKHQPPPAVAKQAAVVVVREQRLRRARAVHQQPNSRSRSAHLPAAAVASRVRHLGSIQRVPNQTGSLGAAAKVMRSSGSVCWSG